MRFLDFHEFCALPDGTIYQEFTEHGSIVDGRGPMIRGGVFFNDDGKARDFVAANLFALPADGEWEAPLEIGNRNWGRWGLFDYDTVFLVYEEADLKQLAGWFLDPQSFTPDPY